jgi:hypothetical protein
MHNLLYNLKTLLCARNVLALYHFQTSTLNICPNSIHIWSLNGDAA